MFYCNKHALPHAIQGDNSFAFIRCWAITVHVVETNELTEACLSILIQIYFIPDPPIGYTDRTGNAVVRFCSTSSDFDRNFRKPLFVQGKEVWSSERSSRCCPQTRPRFPLQRNGVLADRATRSPCPTSPSTVAFEMVHPAITKVAFLILDWF